MVSHVNIEDERALAVWAKTFHVAPEVLVRLVREFGPTEDQIRDALKHAEIGRSAGRRTAPRRG